MSRKVLQKLMDSFVELQKERKGERTYQTYGRKIYVFQEYLEKCGINDDSYAAFLHKARIKDIMDSIKYYVETYDIKYKSTTDTFLAALTVFFEYIQESHGIQNEFFDVNSKSKDLKIAYDSQIKELGLNSSVQAMPLAIDKYSDLVALLNEKIDKPTPEGILTGINNGVYTFYISSLVVKFVLLFGTRNKILSELSIADYDDQLNKISICGYSVHLPDGLARQMKQYCEIRRQIVPKDDVRLFVDINPNQRWDNSKMFFVLKGVLGNTKATSIAKYAIVQMLKNGVPINLIMEFTGYSKSICGHCQELVDEENGIYQLSEKNRRLDSLLRQSKAFDDL